MAGGLCSGKSGSGQRRDVTSNRRGKKNILHSLSVGENVQNGNRYIKRTFCGI